MSILESLDTSDYFNGKMDEWLKQKKFAERMFKDGYLSVLVIDPKNQMPIKDLEVSNPDLNLKYIDLADCKDGDFNRLGQYFNQYINDGEYAYDGLLLDNVDRINAGSDTEYLENFVWQALKKDESDLGGYKILPFGETIPFDKMKIAARCREIPEYLQGKSLLCFFLEV